MAQYPAYASTPRIAGALVVTANTNRDGTGTLATIITGAALGTRIERLVLCAMGTGAAPPDPADSVVTVFLYDGLAYYLYDEFDIGNPAVASATVPAYREERAYSDLVLPSASWSIRAGLTATMTAGVGMMLTAFGADLT
jgi:hypothetical protein